MRFLRFYDGISIFSQLVSSTCGGRSSSPTFLFSLVNNPGRGPITFKPPGEVYSYEYAVYSCSGYGPIFGYGHDICIVSEASSNKDSYSRLGYTYSLASGYRHDTEFAKSFLAGSYQFQPDEVEVFYETT